MALGVDQSGLYSNWRGLEELVRGSKGSCIAGESVVTLEVRNPPLAAVGMSVRLQAQGQSMAE